MLRYDRYSHRKASRRSTQGGYAGRLTYAWPASSTPSSQPLPADYFLRKSNILCLIVHPELMQDIFSRFGGCARIKMRLAPRTPRPCLSPRARHCRTTIRRYGHACTTCAVNRAFYGQSCVVGEQEIGQIYRHLRSQSPGRSPQLIYNFLVKPRTCFARILTLRHAPCPLPSQVPNPSLKGFSQPVQHLRARAKRLRRV